MIKRVLAVLACALLVTGCYRSDFGVTVEDDGSGTVDIVLAVDPDRLQELSEQFGDDAGLGDDPCAQIREESQTDEELPEGAEVEPYEEDGFCGVRVRASFEAGTDIGSFVLDDLQFGSSTDDSPVVFETFVIERDGEGWRFDATTSSSADTEGIDSGILEGFLDDASNTVRVKLPGGVIENNADRREDGALVWDLDLLGSSRTMHARTGPGGGDDDGGGSAVLWIVLGVVAVAAVVVVVLLWRRSRSRKPPAGGPSGPGGPGAWAGAPAPGEGSGGPAQVASASPPESDAAATAAGFGTATAGAPARDAGPQWDPQRQAYIQWDPVGGRWLQYDDAAKEWKALG